jgi:hypothetical protein
MHNYAYMARNIYYQTMFGHISIEITKHNKYFKKYFKKIFFKTENWFLSF